MASIPYQPLSLDGMIGPPEELPPPEAFMEAIMPEEAGMMPEEAEQPPEDQSQPSDDPDYLQYGLAGHLPQEDADAIQQALADELTKAQERSDAYQSRAVERK